MREESYSEQYERSALVSGLISRLLNDVALATQTSTRRPEGSLGVVLARHRKV